MPAIPSAVNTTMSAAAATVSTLLVSMLHQYLSLGVVVWDLIIAGECLGFCCGWPRSCRLQPPNWQRPVGHVTPPSCPRLAPPCPALPNRQRASDV